MREALTTTTTATATTALSRSRPLFGTRSSTPLIEFDSVFDDPSPALPVTDFLSAHDASGYRDTPVVVRRVSNDSVCAPTSSSATTSRASCTPQPSSRKRQRSVTFGPRQEIILEALTPGRGEEGELDASAKPSSAWYTPSELRAFKNSAKRQCRLGRRDLENPLNDAYQFATFCSRNCIATAFDGDEDGSESSGGDFDDGGYEMIVRKLTNNPCFREQRGLERWTSRQQTLSRGLTILQVKTEVFCSQAAEAAAAAAAAAAAPKSALHVDGGVDVGGGSFGCTSEIVSDSAQLRLATSCRLASTRAAKYAQLLARADAVICEQECRTECCGYSLSY